MVCGKKEANHNPLVTNWHPIEVFIEITYLSFYERQPHLVENWQKSRNPYNESNREDSIMNATYEENVWRARLNWVGDMELTLAEKVLLFALVIHADFYTGIVEKSSVTLRKGAGIGSNATFHKAVKRLINRGVLEAEQRPGYTTLYTLKGPFYPAPKDERSLKSRFRAFQKAVDRRT